MTNLKLRLNVYDLVKIVDRSGSIWVESIDTIDNEKNIATTHSFEIRLNYWEVSPKDANPLYYLESEYYVEMVWRRKAFDYLMIYPLDNYAKTDKDATNLEYNKWYPIVAYYENVENLDWAVVQFRDKRDGFMGIPHLVEYSVVDEMWHTWDASVDVHLNKDCEPIAFMLWSPFKE